MPKLVIDSEYYLAQKECGIRTGDIVRVEREAKDFENGWLSFWSTIFMTPTIGQTGKVVSDEDECGLVVEIGDAQFRYPYFVLQKV